MKLKKLDIRGFKSFPDHAELFFNQGITSIVGPNGCGKSNVIDAIRWVMGETSAKGLRGDSMGDVIFAGSDSRKPMGLAEVSLTLTDVEGQLPDKFGKFHEVEITRKLTSSGDSDYLINKISCRLKDINELFMDTGVGRRAYSVIEQGRIDSILNAKPKDRRFLIEEAAGITKYRSRKDEALKKMEQTSANLQRVGDVISEVRREMNALKRQAARAQAYKELRGEKKAAERDLMTASWLELSGFVDEAEKYIGTATAELIEARAELSKLEATTEINKTAMLDAEKRLEAVQKGVFHLRDQISKRENRSEFLRQDSERLMETARRAKEDLSESASRREILANEIEALNHETEQIEERIAKREGRGDALREEHEGAAAALRQVERELEKRKDALRSAMGSLSGINHSIDHTERQRLDSLRQLEGKGRQEAEAIFKIAELEQEFSLRERELTNAEEAKFRAKEERNLLETKLADAKNNKEALAQRAEKARRLLNSAQSRLEGLIQIKESLECYGSGVKEILRQAKTSGRNGVHGVVADTITAPPEYESALEAALGEKLQYVIVENHSRGVEAVQSLKESKRGRSSFAPLNLRQGGPAVFPNASAPWARGPLLDLVEVNPDYEHLAECLLGDVFVVENIEHAVNLWEKNGIKATLVTLDGETLSSEGVIAGGADRGDGAGLLKKNREIRELRAEVEKGEADANALDKALSDMKKNLDELTTHIDEVREEAHRRDLQVAHITKDVAQLRERRERLEERREAIEFERNDLASTAQRMEADLASLGQKKLELLAAAEGAESRIGELEEDAAEAKERVASLNSMLLNHQVEDASDRQRLNGLVERVRSLNVSFDNVSTRSDKLLIEADECLEVRKTRIEELEKLLRETEVLRTELLRCEKELSLQVQNIEERRNGLSQTEKTAAQAKRRSEEIQGRFNEAELKRRELELKRESLADKFRERLLGGIEEEAKKGVAEDFSFDAAKAKIKNLEDKLANFGEINLLAIDEYENRKERYEFLEKQRIDLEESLASLKQAIGKINKVSRDRFAETFDRVSETFHKLYPELFRGGEARLVLTDPEDMLETGIDIIARPPGKRPQHISLLSGGEKALTAVALIFSIFLVKPSPFCILDEVDAPLDEANVGRFNELLETMSEASQFLVITHNKATMEAANHLYGVTMPEPGVSRVVSVHLSDARPAKAA